MGLKLFPFIFILLMFILFSVTSHGENNGKVVLRIQCDKNRVKIGESFTIKYLIENKSGKDIVLCELSILKSITQSIFDGKHKKIIPRYNVVREIKFVPDESDFFVLKNNEQKVYKFDFVVQNGKREVINNTFNGVYLSGPESTYLFLGKHLNFSVYVDYSLSTLEIKQAWKYSYKNVFKDTLKSNKLSFALEK